MDDIAVCACQENAHLDRQGISQEKDMNSVIVEIRAAEGGDDSKILVGYQTEIYAKVARRHCL